MKNTKAKNILGRMKNILLITSVILSILILVSDILYNSLFITLVIKFVAIINIYCFLSVNSDYIINK